jgi:hypothetical protein
VCDDEFIQRFEAGTLGSFRHADHVRLAWLYLRGQPLLEALGRFSVGLQRFATRAGKPERYHQTITWAYLFLIHDRTLDAEAPSKWTDFAASNGDLLRWQPSILGRYYLGTTLASDRARKAFVFPDRFTDAESRTLQEL